MSQHAGLWSNLLNEKVYLPHGANDLGLSVVWVELLKNLGVLNLGGFFLICHRIFLKFRVYNLNIIISHIMIRF